MRLMGNANRYGFLAASLHWVSAAAVLAMLGLGVTARFSDPVQTAALLRIHVPLGVLVFMLTLTRILWRAFDERPADPTGQPRWQAAAAHANHWLLYGVLLLMAASGIGLIALSGAAPILFRGAPGPLPRFTDLAPMAAHFVGALVLIGLLCVHVGAVVYHQFYRRDRLLARMGVSAGAGAAMMTRRVLWRR